jgi:hypothetical protein
MKCVFGCMSNYFGFFVTWYVYSKLELIIVCSIWQDVEEIKEIWNFRNIVLWAIEYCLLSYSVSLGLVCEIMIFI